MGAQLLTDAQMATFLRDGYLVLQPTELSAGLHEELFAAAADLYTESRAVGGSTTHLQYLGDNLLARIPALEQLLQTPTLQDAVRSILGDNTVLHPHHFGILREEQIRVSTKTAICHGTRAGTSGLSGPSPRCSSITRRR